MTIQKVEKDKDGDWIAHVVYFAKAGDPHLHDRIGCDALERAEV